MKIYLDNSASTRVHPEAAKAVYFALTERFANPSSLHTAGQEAERIVKQARQQIAFALAAKPSHLVFTGGGTESDNLALFSSFYSPSPEKNKTLLISAVEHPAVANAANALAGKGIRVLKIPVLPAESESPGMVDLKAFRGLLDDSVGLVSVLHVNNEIGTIQPIDEIARAVTSYAADHDAAILIHSDAVQSFGKLAIDVSAGDFRHVDFVSISAHKIHGPKGVGALYAANPAKLHPMIFGGGQENGIRSGTENVPGIAGFGVSARIASADIVGHAKQVNGCRRRLLEGLRAEIPDMRVNSPEDASVTGKPGCCSPYLLNVSFPGTRGEVILHELEKSGIYVSTGSACASLGKDGPKESGTLAAIGLGKEFAEGAIRFGLSCMNTVSEMEFVIDRLKKAVSRYRRVGSFR
ncbi:MAG: cysteine desulfurase [Clostridiales Family XIII bacterium]|jgi:cysteine desulfurase|nr:cysteine desulfurase [Clostridiales Family XIII bacterium]